MIVPFHKVHIKSEEIDAVVETMKSGWLTMGPKTIEFEKKFKDYMGSTKAVSMSSATAALHLSLKAIGLGKDDEVIVPTNTFIATAEVVTYFDAIPVLCDIEEDTHNIDVSKIEELITSKTRAIIPVHFAGQPCDMDEIYKIAEKYDLKIVEDAAHAIPSSYKGVKIGNLAKSDITCFSFYATKSLAVGEGGMVTTNNLKYAKCITVNRLHGISRDAWDRYTEQGSWYYEVIDNGYKYNTTDINSTIGIIQLQKQDQLRKKRLEVANKYNEAFLNNANIVLPFIKEDRTTSWHLYVIKVKNRDKVIKELNIKNIGSSVHFIPIHKHPYYKEKYNYKNNDFPVANKVFDESLSLPIYPDMSSEEIEYVIKNVNDIVNNV